MKILHILYQSIPNISGSSIRSRDLINSQIKLGLTPIIITSPFQPPINANSKIEEIDGVMYYRTYVNSKDLNISEKQSSFLIQLKKMFLLFQFIINVYRIAKKENVDIIHAHAMFFCALAGKYSSWKLNKPFVYEVRSLWEERYKNSSFLNKIIFSFVTILETISMSLSDILVVINDNLRNTLSERFLLKKKKMFVVKNAVNISRVKQIKIDRNSLVFGYVGTISPIEGLDLLINAFNNLYSKSFSNKLIIYGDGIAYANLKDLSKNNPLIQFKGKFNQSQIAEVYSTIDVVINPRINNYLTNSVTPLKPLEAMAYKKLVLASDVGGMMELIEHNTTGYIFKSDSIKSIEKIVCDVVNANNHNHIIEAAYEDIIENRNWDKNATIYLDIYNQVINE